VRRKFGQRGIDGLEARTVEAFLILEQELAEVRGGAAGGAQSNTSAAKRRNG
jgi:hypothetical protein